MLASHSVQFNSVQSSPIHSFHFIHHHLQLFWFTHFGYSNSHFALKVSIICMVKLHNKFIQRSTQFYVLNYTKIPPYNPINQMFGNQYRVVSFQQFPKACSKFPKLAPSHRCKLVQVFQVHSSSTYQCSLSLQSCVTSHYGQTQTKDSVLGLVI